MVGPSFFIATSVTLILLVGLFYCVYHIKRLKGERSSVAAAWATGAVVLLPMLPLGDGLPTWVAYEYCSDREDGVRVFKTLERWRAENQGVEETMSAYGFKDKRRESKNLGDGKLLTPLNDRFAYTSHTQKIFLTVFAHRYELIDVKKQEVLASYASVGAGNSGGFATGGPGWWAFWLIHKPRHTGYTVWSEYVQWAENLGKQK